MIEWLPKSLPRQRAKCCARAVSIRANSARSSYTAARGIRPGKEGNDGLRTVAIDQIRGSEGRCRYFDRDFRPLHDAARGRWLNIARARQQGKNLPLVSLVRVGDIYFVRDGHHRISVARALGQIEIDARVTVWQVTGPLP